MPKIEKVIIKILGFCVGYFVIAVIGMLLMPVLMAGLVFAAMCTALAWILDGICKLLEIED